MTLFRFEVVEARIQKDGILTLSILRATTLFCVLTFILATRAGAHMGRVIPLCSAQGENAALVANIVSAYIGEQLGRNVRVVNAPDDESCLAEIEARKAPMTLVNSGTDIGKGIYVQVGPVMSTSVGSYRLVMGKEAANRLIYSLMPDYLAMLSESFGTLSLKEALRDVRSGKGPKKVAIDLLMKADLL